MSKDKTNHRTTYVISCPSAQPDCALKPNLTLTEGTDLVRWESSTKGTKASGYVPCFYRAVTSTDRLKAPLSLTVH